jgi:hypothetical protein
VSSSVSKLTSTVPASQIKTSTPFAAWSPHPTYRNSAARSAYSCNRPFSSPVCTHPRSTHRSHAQRQRQTCALCVDDNTQSTLGHISPFEMDCGTFPVSAFAPSLPYNASDPTPDDEDSQQLIKSPPVISPEWAAEAIRVSVAAFHRFAHTPPTCNSQHKNV